MSPRPGPDLLLQANIPIPFSPPLEAFAPPEAANLVDAVRRVVK